MLNGPAGVGKSTAASLLTSWTDASAWVRGDDLKDFVVSKPTGGTASRVTYRNGAAVCAELISSGFSFVVFDFVFNDAESVATFRSNLRTREPFVFSLVTLWASETVLRERRKGRVDEPRYVDLMDRSRGLMEGNLDELGIVIDVETLDAKEVADKLAQLVART